MPKKKRIIKKYEDQIAQLEELKKQAEVLKIKISKQKLDNFKQFNVRNIRVVGKTFNFLLPFAFASGLTVAGGVLIDLGHPFIKDKIVEYKEYDLDYKTDGYVSLEEFYKKNSWYNVSNSKGELLVYTPWEQEDDHYTRKKLNYSLAESNMMELMNAVLEENFNYIDENLDVSDEEIQITNSIESYKDQEYFIDANLHTLNKNDTFNYDESGKRNALVTIGELVLALGAGFTLDRYRSFDYRAEINSINNDYSSSKEELLASKKQLNDTNKKILTLSRKKGCINNAK